MAAGNDVSQAALQTLLSQIGPQLQADQLAYQGYGSQLQALPSQIQQQDTYQQAMAGYSLQNLGIGQEKLGLQAQGMGLQSQLAHQQYDIGQQEFGIQQGLANNQFQAEANQLYAQQAVSGAQNAPGAKQAQLQLYAGAMGQNQLANLSNLSQQAQFAEQYGGSAGGQNYGGGQQAIAMQNLNLIAQANGLSAQQVIDQLNYGIAQNKQQGIVSANQILTQMGNLAAGDITQAGAALAPAGYSPGINPIVAGQP